jgi:hypothetical protein
MYGAIPYLIDAFGCDRDQAFRIVCEWLDAQTAADGAGAPHESMPTQSVVKGDDGSGEARAVRRKPKRAVQRNHRKPSRHKAA